MCNVDRLVVAAILCSMATISISQNNNRCDMCKCTIIKSVLQLNCSDVKPRTEYSNMIQLPYEQSYNSYPYDTIQAEFNRDQIRNLRRLEIEDLTSLSLEDNEISSIGSDTFIRLKHLKYLSLKKNFIQKLNENSFQTLLKLEELDLSCNQLEEISSNTFTNMKYLKILFLPNNRLSKLERIMFPNSLTILDISYNYIEEINNEVFDNTNDLQVLNLSNNNISAVNTYTFISLRSLASLDLSCNNIGKIDDNSFVEMNSLEKLNLSHNELKDLNANANIPSGTEILDLSSNLFTEINAFVFSISGLQELYLQQNKLKSLEININTNIKVLNVSNNQIEKFSITMCQYLENLDLSSNKLESIPEQIHGQAMPALRSLSLDFNPIRNIFFPSGGDDERASLGMINLTWVSVSHLEEIEELKEGAFSGLSSSCGGCGRHTSSDYETEGELENMEVECTRELFIRVSHNPRLANIQRGAFKDVALCKLDLSSNSLTSLDQEMIDWETLKEVNLQENPWSCTCPFQWVLDTLLPTIYKTNSELLYEFRCNSPATLRNKRLAHFFDWKYPALCRETNEKLRMMPEKEDNLEITLGVSGPMLAVVLSLAAVGAILLVLAVVLQRRYNSSRRTRNRRF
ncbi:hypothetical protein L9F63_014210 [Diploptera punctata]|uniref:Uncharacterized protein n=1 Tax=Diploptera punctata TaxID=6984 RepID=A0AAD8AAJ8_DIPPU|nr:hypothetical protein L9F63_014210 [Diploptera punctata]